MRVPPNHPLHNRIVHYKPCILGYPPILGNLHMYVYLYHNNNDDNNNKHTYIYIYKRPNKYIYIYTFNYIVIEVFYLRGSSTFAVGDS